ncbi:putative receptor protein kinase ZmPK1 [Camellia lanceoleosa]|uniref:Receptor protein kinase ZmPK1 n=1 Tax=Camellia lanceoleosa TaxID=1840588 RepID=A0ACC0FU38_9ERIC|nr:putative receptor protein kinase ZmPK1 [Camellia lanceoleosa]
MSTLFVFLALYLVLSSPTSSSPSHSLSKSSSLYVEKPDHVLISPNGVFSAGFHPVGVNAYSFAIWFTKTTQNHTTVIWMANRDQPVNGRLSKLSLLKDGNLILTDANNRSIFWATNTASSSLSLQLQLQNSVFDGPETSSIYWHDPWLLSSEVNRSRYNDTSIAVFDSLGHCMSSDRFEFEGADFGRGPKRRLMLDFDGNLRLYSLEETSGNWVVSWQAMSKPCRIHGACGPNSIYNFDRSSGRKCSCLPRFKMRNPKDWIDGCEPEFNLSCSGGNQSPTTFLKLPHTDFYGYNINILRNYTFERCEKKCLESCNCKGFHYRFKEDDGVYDCYTKWVFHNGHHSPNFVGTLTHKNSLAKHEYYFPIDAATGFRKFSYEELKKATRELVTGKNPTTGFNSLSNRGMEETTLVKWVMEKVMNRGSPMTLWVDEIVDPSLNGAYDAGKVEKLVEVALQCLEEEKDAKPTMTRVLDMLQR